MRRNLFWLSDGQWSRIAPLLPTDIRGKDRVDDRRVISGILHVLKSGCRWCEGETQMIDSTHIKSHRSASGGNVWPAPSASGLFHLV
jgi:transposase